MRGERRRRKRKAYSEPRKKSLKIFFYPSCHTCGKLHWDRALSGSIRGARGLLGWGKASASMCGICLCAAACLVKQWVETLGGRVQLQALPAGQVCRCHHVHGEPGSHHASHRGCRFFFALPHALGREGCLSPWGRCSATAHPGGIWAAIGE